MKLGLFKTGLILLSIIFSASVFAKNISSDEQNRAYFVEITSSDKDVPVQFTGTIVMKHKGQSYAESEIIPVKTTPWHGLFNTDTMDIYVDNMGIEVSKLVVKITDNTNASPGEGLTLLTTKGHKIAAHVDSAGNIHANPR